MPFAPSESSFDLVPLPIRRDNAYLFILLLGSIRGCHYSLVDIVVHGNFGVCVCVCVCLVIATLETVFERFLFVCWVKLFQFLPILLICVISSCSILFVVPV